MYYLKLRQIVKFKLLVYYSNINVLYLKIKPQGFIIGLHPCGFCASLYCMKHFLQINRPSTSYNRKAQNGSINPKVKKAESNSYLFKQVDFVEEYADTHFQSDSSMLREVVCAEIDIQCRFYSDH